MSTLNHLLDIPEQICYVQCGFCATILLVSVPCSSLSMVVTVRCGHCTGLLSVNMMKVSFVPFHLLASLGHDDEWKEELSPGSGEAHLQRALDVMTSSDNEVAEDRNRPLMNHATNKPPEKRQRAPSAYNRFIKDEIKRLKAENPNMAHKEAFSTAAKNWAQFPPIHFIEDGESSGDQEDENATWSYDAPDEVNTEGKRVHERKAPRHSIGPRHPSSEEDLPELL